ncbi:acyltransferase family protein [Bacteroidota bacterium]
MFHTKSLLNRYTTPDLLKGLAVLFMIQVHSLHLFTSVTFQESIFAKVIFFFGGPAAAPVFLAIMGYFLGASNKTIFQKLKRGLDLIALGFLLNLFLNLNLFIKIFLKQSDANPLNYLLGVDIFFVAGISIILISLLQKLFKDRFYLYLIAALLFALAGHLFPNFPIKLQYLQAFIYGEFSWSYFPIFPWVSYSLLGTGFFFIFAKIRDKFTNPLIKNIVFSILSVIVIVFLPNVINISSILSEYYHHTLLFFLWNAAFLSWWLMLCNYIDNLSQRSSVLNYIRWTGKNVTIIYIVQWIVIGNLATSFYRQFEFWGWLTGFIIALSISTLVAYLWEKYFSEKKKSAINY